MARRELEGLLEQIDRGELAPVYLVTGDEFLARKDAAALARRIVGDDAAGLNLVVLDAASPRELAAELGTLPLFPGRKAVVTHDPEWLAPKKGRGDGLARAREAWTAGRRKEAARRVLTVAGKAGWRVDEIDPQAGAVTPEQWRDVLGIELARSDVDFLAEVVAFCREEGLTSGAGDDSALQALLERGPPPGHSLIVVAGDVDAKHPLARLSKEKGRVLSRKSSAKLKELDLGELSDEVLGPLGKHLSPRAEELLKDRVGPNMRMLESELKKLALYVDGASIEPADVSLLVARVRDEEFLELSDALQKRDLKAALAYVDDALAQGAATLQLLGAIASIVRTLLENRERLTHLSAGKPPRSFDDFQRRLFPTIAEETKLSKGRPPHPYAAFMAMQAAARYERAELLGALLACAEADLALKLGGGRLVIERLLWTVAGGLPPWDSGLAAVRRHLERT